MSDNAQLELIAAATDPERSYGVDEAFVRACDRALAEDRIEELDAMLSDLHASDMADVIEELAGENRLKLLEYLRGRLDPELLAHL
ncbi:MAG: magnesium transporter, partial [Alphaproteobacteria bacterium]